MAKASPRGERLRCSKDTTIADMVKVYEDFMQEIGSRDMLGHLSSLASISWKHSPKVSQLVEASQLIKILCMHCQCVKISHVVAKNAAISCHESKLGPCLVSGSHHSVEVLAMLLSFRIRCVLSKFRTLKSDPAALAIVFSKQKVSRKKAFLICEKTSEN